MEKLQIEVNKKGASGKYEPVGNIAIFVPTLEEVGFVTNREKDKDGKDVYEDGLPVYVSDAANWVLGAILASVKAQARNRLISGTVELKEGLKISETLEELMAEGERNNGAALAAIRELKAKFATWVATLGKSAAAQAVLITLFGNKQALAIQGAAHKEKMQGYIQEFAETLNEEELVKGERYLQALLDASAVTEEAQDF